MQTGNLRLLFVRLKCTLKNSHNTSLYTSLYTYYTNGNNGGNGYGCSTTSTTNDCHVDPVDPVDPVGPWIGHVQTRVEVYIWEYHGAKYIEKGKPIALQYLYRSIYVEYMWDPSIDI